MADLERKFKDLLFSVRRSVRYHNRRTLFFDRIHKISAFLSALFGTATITVILKDLPHELSISLAGAVVVFSVVDLVIGSAQAARLHNDLSREFFNLEKSIINLDEETEDNLIKFTSLRLDIESKEPPPLKILDVICHNELMRAMGYDKSQLVDIKWYQRLFAHFFDIREHVIHPKC